MSATLLVVEHDFSLSLWLDQAQNPLVNKAFHSAIATLRADGFIVRADKKHDARYPSLKGTRKRGRKGFLEVIIERMGRTVDVKFFQNGVFENKNGGEYDFNKHANAPYLVRLAYAKMRQRIDHAWQTLGLPPLNAQAQTITRGKAFIGQRERELNAFQRRLTKPFPDECNARSAAQHQIFENDTVFFSQRGRWLRGTAHHNINNMWWVLLPCGEVHNVACFDLFHRSDIETALKGRVIPLTKALAQISLNLNRLVCLVTAKDVERAAALHNRRHQLEQQQHLEREQKKTKVTAIT